MILDSFRVSVAPLSPFFAPLFVRQGKQYGWTELLLNRQQQRLGTGNCSNFNRYNNAVSMFQTLVAFRGGSQRPLSSVGNKSYTAVVLIVEKLRRMHHGQLEKFNSGTRLSWVLIFDIESTRAVYFFSSFLSFLHLPRLMRHCQLGKFNNSSINSQVYYRYSITVTPLFFTFYFLSFLHPPKYGE